VLSGTGVSIPVTFGDNVIFQTSTPDSLAITVKQGSAVITVNNLLAAKVDANTSAIQVLQVTSTYSTTELPTGATYNGKVIYRRAFNLSITQASDQDNETPLIPTNNYVDAIINSGGYWTTGNGVEKYAVNGTYQGSLFGYVLVTTANQLYFRSRSTVARNNNAAFVWVDYTKV
jgi:hypothetical protein